MAKYRDLPRDAKVTEQEVISELLEPKPIDRTGQIIGQIIAYAIAFMAVSTLAALWYRFVFLWIIMP